MKAVVIIPVYNQEPFLRRALDSLRMQTRGDFTIICVDDGSTDGSAAILREYAAHDFRTYVIAQPNGGVSAARNAGLDTALADPEVTHIMFLDADDAYRPDCVAEVLSAAEAHPAAVIEWDWTDRVRERSPNIWCKCYPRACVADVRFFTGANVAEDIAFNFEVFHRHCPPLVHLSQRLYDYTENPASAMHRAFTAEDFRKRNALIERLIAVASDDPVALKRLARTEIPDLLRQFLKQLKRADPAEKATANEVFRSEISSLRRRGLLRPRGYGLNSLKAYLRLLSFSAAK